MAVLKKVLARLLKIMSPAMELIAAKIRGYFDLPAALFFAACCLINIAAAQKVGDFTFARSGSNLQLVSYTGSGGTVVIPGMVDGVAVTQISLYVFDSVVVPTTVSIPVSVAYIGLGSSASNPAIQAFIVAPGNTNFSSLNGMLFGDNGKRLLRCPGGFIGNLEIPTSVTNIQSGSLAFCTRLTSVKIPGSVTQIGSDAFKACSSLTKVRIPSSVKVLETNCFDGCDQLKSMTFRGDAPLLGEYGIGDLPSDFTVSYYEGASGFTMPTWNGFKAIKLSGPDDGLEDFSYTSDGASITITRYTGIGGEVVIPDSLDNLPVRTIGDSAFRSLGSLTGVTIPRMVTTIGASAFANCVLLSHVTIPEGVTSIGDSAFRSCNGMKSVLIPQSVTKIGESAFQSCESLVNLTIPDEVMVLGAGAFQSCWKLKSILIPSGLTSLPDNVFRGCISLTGVTIPENIKSIGDRAFYVCLGLETVKIPASVTRIGESTCGWCERLSEVVIPGSVENVGDYAFFSCVDLESVRIEPGVIKLGIGAFQSCRSLANVAIPASMTTIESRVFTECSALLDISVDKKNPQYSSLEGVLFNKDATVLLQYPMGRLAGYVVPAGVERIGAEAFHNCSSLTKLTLPESLRSIRSSAFYQCQLLQKVTIPLAVTEVGSDAFLGCLGLKNLTFQGDAPGTAMYFIGVDSEFAVFFYEGADGFTTPTWSGSPSVDLGDPVDLLGLQLSAGILSPFFDPARTTYTAHLPNQITSLSIKVTPLSPAAALGMRIRGSPITEFSVSENNVPLDLLVGANQIEVIVTKGVTTKTYIVTVHRAATNTMIENWRFENFGTTENVGVAANDADPDGDGLANLIELAFNLNPNSAGVVTMVPETGTVGLPTFTFDLNPDGMFTCEYLRRKGDGIAYQPIMSQSLEPDSFSPLTGEITLREIDGQWESVTVRQLLDINKPLSDNPARMFCTVKVTVP